MFEITPKFRAWDKAHEVMRNVLLIDFISRSIICETEDDRNIKLYDITYELMQSTGIKDNNGVEIYEGDIAQDSYSGEVSFIEFKEGAFYITFGNVTELLLENDDLIEVIGNIYENEEFLEAMR